MTNDPPASPTTEAIRACKSCGCDVRNLLDGDDPAYCSACNYGSVPEADELKTALAAAREQIQRQQATLEAVNAVARDEGYGQGELDEDLAGCLKRSLDLHRQIHAEMKVWTGKATMEQRIAAKDAEIAALRDGLFAEADRYEKDGQPGPLALNFWGWRDVAATLRRIADGRA